MTAHHLINLHITRSNFNQKDAPPRQRRKDVAEQFIAAGFEMVDWNKFQFKVYDVVFSIMPSFQGFKVSGPLVPLGDEPIFAFGTSPDTIADWILDWPQRASDWMTEGLPEGAEITDSAPACYGLAQGEY